MAYCMIKSVLSSGLTFFFFFFLIVTLIPSAEISTNTFLFFIFRYLCSYLILLIAATISTRLFGRGISSVPIYLHLKLIPCSKASSLWTGILKSFESSTVSYCVDVPPVEILPFMKFISSTK